LDRFALENHNTNSQGSNRDIFRSYSGHVFDEINVQVPLRVSFMGGGTDVDPFRSTHGSQIIATTIKQYVIVKVKSRSDGKMIRIKNLSKITDLIDIEREFNLRQSLFLSPFMLFEKNDLPNFEMTIESPVLPGSGLGASSAIEIGIVKALCALTQLEIEPEKLARMAYIAEREIAKIPGGFQDHVVCSLGGFKKYSLGSDLAINHARIEIDIEFREKLEESIILVHSGSNRENTNVLSDQIDRNISGENDLLLKKQIELTQEFEDALRKEEIPKLGKVLDNSWSYKKQLGRHVSNTHVDLLYEKLCSAGAIGGKLLGAGGGGTLLLVIDAYKKAGILDLIDKLNLEHKSISFEEDGAKVF